MNRGWIIQRHSVEDWKARDKVFCACVYTNAEEFIEELTNYADSFMESYTKEEFTIDIPTAEEIKAMSPNTYYYVAYNSNCSDVISYSCLEIINDTSSFKNLKRSTDV